MEVEAVQLRLHRQLMLQLEDQGVEVNTIIVILVKQAQLIKDMPVVMRPVGQATLLVRVPVADVLKLVATVQLHWPV